MIRVLIFLGVVAAVAALEGWLADQPGNVVIPWRGEYLEMPVWVAATGVAVAVVAGIVLWSIVRTIRRSPDLIGTFLSHRRGVRGYLAISRGLVAVGAGDAKAARRAADEAS